MERQLMRRLSVWRLLLSAAAWGAIVAAAFSTALIVERTHSPNLVPYFIGIGLVLSIPVGAIAGLIVGSIVLMLDRLVSRWMATIVLRATVAAIVVAVCGVTMVLAIATSEIFSPDPPISVPLISVALGTAALFVVFSAGKLEQVHTLGVKVPPRTTELSDGTR